MRWSEMLKKIAHRDKIVKIGLVGKYVSLHDAYLSVAEALRPTSTVMQAWDSEARRNIDSANMNIIAGKINVMWNVSCVKFCCQLYHVL